MYNNFSSKKTKKVISALLASALVVTAAPITSNAATAKVLGVKKSFTVSGTKVTGLSAAEKKVVKVSINKKKVTVKGLKAGKVSFKIGKKSYTVKVGATKVAVSAAAKTIKVGETVKVTAKATNGAKDTIKFTSSDKAVATVSASKKTASAKGAAAVTVTALTAGTAKITATSAYTGKKASVTINVEAVAAEATATPAAGEVTATPVAGEVTATPVATETPATGSAATATPVVTAVPEKKTGAIAKVENSISGFDNTVLVNDNAIVTVVVKDANEQPVANKSVLFAVNKTTPYKAKKADNTENTVSYKALGSTVVTTDSNGQASFVIAKDGTEAKITDEYAVAAVTYTASVVGSSNPDDKVTGTVRFAALNLGKVELPTTLNKKDANDKTRGNIVPGINALEAGTAKISTTKALSGNMTEYVASAQVSKEKATDHDITFSVTPKIILPSVSETNDKVNYFTQEVEDGKSGEYGTYANISKIVPLKVDTSALQYATLNFDGVQLSQYSSMKIQCYTDKECKYPLTTSGASIVIDGAKEQSDFAYQIPVTSAKVAAIKVTLTSAGQVQTNKNDGFSIKNITGVYNGAGTTTSGGEKDLTSATVKWETVNAVYSNEMTLNYADATSKLGIHPAAETSKFSYQVPVFPFTGDAVIKEYDLNKKVISYYLAPTMNNDKNVNEISALVLAAAGESTVGYKAYKATEEEATAVVGTITQTGNNVTVNSEKVGSTTLKGTISIEGVGSTQLNASNNTVYTSVQWNPIPTEEEKKTEKSNAFLALAGQKISVKAQLTDANGNPVSLSGQKVTFYTNSTNPVPETGNVSGAAVISNTGETDVNGRTTLTLTSSVANTINNLSAKAANEKYNVVLYVGGNATTSVKLADLYWVEANLKFTKSTASDAVAPNEIVTNNDTQKVEGLNPTVGTPWEYAVKTVGNTLSAGILNGYLVTIDGLKVAMSGNVENKGTYEYGDGVVDGTSLYVNQDVVSAKIDGTSISGEVAFTAKKTVAGVETAYNFVSVGEGTPNLNAKMNLNVNWKKDGAKFSIVNPFGTTIANGETVLYIKATDGTGVNALAGEEVTVELNNGQVSANGGTYADKVTATTNDKGIVAVVVKKGAGANSTVVTAKIKNVDQVASTTINWANPTTTTFGAVRATTKTGATNQIDVVFNSDIYAGSVQAGEFVVEGIDSNNKKVYYDVTKAEVNGKVVTLTLSTALTAGEFTVGFDTKTVDGVTYALADEFGRKLVAASNKVTFYSTKNASFSVTSAVKTTTGVAITVEGMNTPESEVSAKNFVVTINGSIIKTDSVAQDPANARKYTVYASNIDGTTVNENNKLTISYFGTTESATVTK